MVCWGKVEEVHLHAPCFNCMQGWAIVTQKLVSTFTTSNSNFITNVSLFPGLLTKGNSTRFEVLTVIKTEVEVFCFVMPCSGHLKHWYPITTQRPQLETGGDCV
jgi:hypothetical protein